MRETTGNSFDTTTSDGRMDEIVSVLAVQFPNQEHQSKFLNGQWKVLGEQTPRELVMESEEGFRRVKDLLKSLGVGQFPEALHTDTKQKEKPHITEMKLG